VVEIDHQEGEGAAAHALGEEQVEALAHHPLVGQAGDGIDPGQLVEPALGLLQGGDLGGDAQDLAGAAGGVAAKDRLAGREPAVVAGDVSQAAGRTPG
jgi:hypothetical protein